jgi:hypothetical protein
MAAAADRSKLACDTAPHCRHVDVEEDAVTFQPEPFRARGARDEEHVRADRLHLLTESSRPELHGPLEHAFHGGDLKPRPHLLGLHGCAHRRRFLR